jgi:FHS family L-fucose permease-like MFS transporter
MKIKTLPVFLAFLVMGFGDAVGPFVGLAKDEFTLSNTLAFLIPFVGFIMFGLLSVPLGVYQAKKGKKFILLLGLIIMFVGIVIPIFGFSSFGLFLVTVLLLGAGATTLQVAGNPIMRDVSSEGKYSRNLSLGQFVKAIGSLSGPVIPVIASAYFRSNWKVLFPIYSIAILITIISVAALRVEEKEADNQNPVTLRSCLSLLAKPFVAMMVAAIFLYVGAEVCMSSGIPLYLHSKFGIEIEKLGLLGTGLFFTTLMIGRFVGGVILNWILPKHFLVATTILSVIAVLGLFTGVVSIVIISVVVIGLAFANIFPLIFSITVDSMPEKTNELSGLMVTAIVGGAFIPPIMGFVADRTAIEFGFVVPLVALLYIGWVSLSNLKSVQV